MEEKKPIFHLVRGVPGSGKSTFAKTFDCLHLEADMYHMKDEKYCFSILRIADAHAWCFESAKVAIEAKMDVCVSNTFCKLDKYLSTYLQLAKASHTIKIYDCYGEFDNVHNVPTLILDNMRKSFKPVTQEYLNRIGVTAEVVNVNPTPQWVIQSRECRENFTEESYVPCQDVNPVSETTGR